MAFQGGETLGEVGNGLRKKLSSSLKPRRSSASSNTVKSPLLITRSRESSSFGVFGLRVMAMVGTVLVRYSTA